MKRVLSLAYFFPPLGGAGVQRNVQLARHLPELGYHLVVVTGPGERGDYRWTPADAELADERVQAEVHRVAGPEPSLDAPRSARLLRLPTAWGRWWTAAAVPLALEVGSGADVIHASLAPFATADAALAVARRLRRPLVVDLEDPWALDDTMVYPSALHRRLELGRMRRVLAAADVVVMNTFEARDRAVEALRDVSPDRVAAVPNAYDPLAFAGTAPEPRLDGRFRIVHTGSLHTDFGLAQQRVGLARRLLGGAVAGVDILPRSHVYLLDAVHWALEARPRLRGRVEVHLAGVFTAEDRAVASRYPFVRLHDFLPHRETAALMRTADLLFLPLYDLPPGRRAAIVPHKTYEYLASGRPILAAVPDGDARDLLADSGVASLCRPSDSEGMRDALVAEFDRWAAGGPPPMPRADTLGRCSAQRLAADLAAVYESLSPSPASSTAPGMALVSG